MTKFMLFDSLIKVTLFFILFFIIIFRLICDKGNDSKKRALTVNKAHSRSMPVLTQCFCVGYPCFSGVTHKIHVFMRIVFSMRLALVCGVQSKECSVKHDHLFGGSASMMRWRKVINAGCFFNKHVGLWPRTPSFSVFL